MGEMSAWKLIQAGGVIMYPILLCSILALGIIIEKVMYFFNIQTDIPKLKKEVFDNVQNNKIREAIQLCDANASPVARIMKAGLIKFGSTREEIKESMEDASLYEIPKLESRLSALATIAHIAPLLGLLGTVTGMARCFYTIQTQAAAMSPLTPSDLAGGIWEALLTTVAGLMVAIPAYMAYNYFVNRVHHFTLDMERAATELINVMGQLTETRL